MPKRKVAGKALFVEKPSRVLWALFLAGVAVRFSLALLYKINPSIIPDEFLYENIAKSLYAQGEILFRGQPTNYAFLLYPLLLVPIYSALPVGIDIFRAAQFVNVCLMSSIVFPTYYATKEITGDHGRALTVTVVALLLPDMVMSAFLMSESLVYALYFASFFAAVLAVKRGKAQYYALVGVLGALTFYTKNFHILFAAVFLALMLIANLFAKKYREALYAALGGAILYGVSAGLMALSENVFHLVAPTYSINTAGDVVRGLGNMASNLAPYAEGFVMYAAFFTIALAGAYFVMPAFNLRSYTRDNRLIALAVGGSLAAVLMAVLYVIHLSTRTGVFLARVELRYLSMYSVPLVALSLSRELDDKRLNIYGAIWLLLAAVYSAVLGLGSGFSSMHADVDNFALAIVAPSVIGDAACRALSIVFAAALLLGAFYLFKKGWTRRIKRAALVFLTVIFISSNVAAHILNTSFNHPDMRVDSREAAKAIDEVKGDALMITRHDNTFENLAVDARTKTMLDSVSYTEFIEKLRNSNGAYEPFIPNALRVTRPDRPLTDASLLVFVEVCARLIQFTPNVDTRMSENGYFIFADIEKGQPAFASLALGMTFDGEIPTEEFAAGFNVLDPAVRSDDGYIRFRLRVYSPQDGASIYLNSGMGAWQALLSAGENEVYLEILTRDEFPQDVALHTDAPGVLFRNYEVLYE